MSQLGLTRHAIEQFASRWRPEASEAAAEAEFRTMVQQAAATRKRTLSGDAQIYLATSTQGEQIGLVVRDRAVITVLPHGSGETREVVDYSDDAEVYDEESQADLRATRDILSKEKARSAEEQRQKAALEKEERKKAFLEKQEQKQKKRENNDEENRKRNAEKVVRDWKSGREFTRKALVNAHKTLGLSFTLPSFGAFEVSGDAPMKAPPLKADHVAAAYDIEALRKLVTEVVEHDVGQRLPNQWQVRAERTLAALKVLETKSRAIPVPERTIAAIRDVTAGALRELVAEAARDDGARLLPHMWWTRADQTLR